MASFLAILDDWNYERHETRIRAGAVLPIDSYRSEEDESFATGVSTGGALYLVVAGDDDEIWLVAVLESPETAGLKKSDRRAPGWYAPANTTPVTDIRKLKKKLNLRGDLGDALEAPRPLAPTLEAALREFLGDSDTPVLGVLDVQPVVAPKVTGSPLERAASYLAGSYVTAGIEALAEAWRENRAPELADLIDRANRVAPGFDRPLFDRRVQDWNDDSFQLWHDTFAADPVASMPQLLLNLGLGGAHAVAERVRKLAERPEDPRIGRRLAELIPTSSGDWDADARYWAPVIDLWLRGRDMRLGELWLEGEEAIVGPKARTLFKHAADPKSFFKGKPPTIAASDRGLVAAIENELTRLEAPLRLECDLVDTIAAHPDDDEPRLIYADQLQQRGHPRGEYIALACQKHRGTLTPAMARRLAVLAELPYLCGPIDDLATRAIRAHDRGIDRSFIVSWKAMPTTWFELAAHPLARAIVKLDMSGQPRSRRAEGIAAVMRVASRLEQITDVGTQLGKQLVAMVDGWKTRSGAVVRDATSKTSRTRSAPSSRGRRSGS